VHLALEAAFPPGEVKGHSEGTGKCPAIRGGAGPVHKARALSAIDLVMPQLDSLV
jgi:hypothetical protein